MSTPLKDPTCAAKFIPSTELRRMKPIFCGRDRENPTDGAGPLGFSFVPDLPVPTSSGSQHEGLGVEQDLLGDSSWVTVLSASMIRTFISFVLLNTETFLADIVSGGIYILVC